jgi:hypothetical protein
MALRPCLDCGALTPTARCTTCARPRERARTQAKRQTRPRASTAETKRRADVVAAWRATRGDWCPGYGREPHASSDLTADHAIAVGAGGSEDGPLTVLCRSCNGRKQARG